MLECYLTHEREKYTPKNLGEAVTKNQAFDKMLSQLYTC